MDNSIEGSEDPIEYRKDRAAIILSGIFSNRDIGLAKAIAMDQIDQLIGMAIRMEVKINNYYDVQINKEEAESNEEEAESNEEEAESNEEEEESNEEEAESTDI